MEALTRYLVFRVAVLSPSSFLTSSPSAKGAAKNAQVSSPLSHDNSFIEEARSLLSSLFHPTSEPASSDGATRSPSPLPPQRQTMAHFICDPYVAKLLALLAWWQIDLKRYLEASRVLMKVRTVLASLLMSCDDAYFVA